MNTLAVLNKSLPELLALPDAGCALALNNRLLAWNVVDELHERSYAERGLIAIQFKKRDLWKYLIDPDVNEPFANFDAWMSCSHSQGKCRRANYDAYGDMKQLADVPAEKLIDIPRENIKTMLELSTEDRNDPDILAAAHRLPKENFREKIEKERPMQHIERRFPLTLKPGRSDKKIIDEWFNYAREHDIAGNLTEAIVRACEMALDDARLDEELAAMPAPEMICSPHGTQGPEMLDPELRNRQ